MQFRLSTSLKSDLLRVALLLGGIAASLVQTTTAEASCGDHLWMPSHAAGMRERDDEPQRPCQGPGCRRSQPPVAPLPVTVVETPVEHATLLPKLAAVIAERAWCGALDGQTLRATGYPMGLERPPARIAH